MIRTNWNCTEIVFRESKNTFSRKQRDWRNSQLNRQISNMNVQQPEVEVWKWKWESVCRSLTLCQTLFILSVHCSHILYIPFKRRQNNVFFLTVRLIVSVGGRQTPWPDWKILKFGPFWPRIIARPDLRWSGRGTTFMVSPTAKIYIFYAFPEKWRRS